MPNYMLFLYESPTAFDGISPEEMQAIIQKYGAWAQSLTEQERLLHSQKLCDGTGRVMRGQAERVQITDGPYSETKEVIGGYFAIRADDYEHAVEIARDCPHLDYGGTIEVREIDAIEGET